MKTRQIVAAVVLMLVGAAVVAIVIYAEQQRSKFWNRWPEDKRTDESVEMRTLP